MEIEKEVFIKKKLQSLILNIIENCNDDEDFSALAKFIDDNNINKNKQDLHDLFHMILAISTNHHREMNFFKKIIQIFIFLLSDIQLFFTDIGIYNIFKKNQIILFYLIQNNIFLPGEKCINRIVHNNIKSNRIQNRYFLYPVIKSYINEDIQKQIEKEISEIFKYEIDIFHDNCLKGENNSKICCLIRNDFLDDFVIYVNQTNFNLNSKIPNSIFETNEFLIERQPSLIEYAAFFGSINIFKYLRINNVQMTESLWEFGIHSRNAEIIHLIEDIFNKPSNPMNLLRKSIESHHNEISHYIEENYLYSDDRNKNDFFFILNCYNYEFWPTDFNVLLTHFSINYCTYHSIKNKTRNYISFYQSFLLLSKITIPSSVTKICDSVFKNFKNLKEIIISNSVVSIGDNSFEGCISLVEISFENPSSLIEIGQNSFKGCSSIEKIELPTTVEKIKYGAFNGCISLKEIIIPSSIKEIGEESFRNCCSLNKIEIPLSITKIEEFLFYNCFSLQQISIPSVTKIGCFSFYECSSLSKILINSSIKEIGDFSFCGCNLLSQSLFPFPLKTNKILLQNNKKRNENDKIQKYIHDKKDIYLKTIDYLEASENNEELFLDLFQTCKNQRIFENESDSYEFLQILNKISQYHVKFNNIIEKTEKILSIFKDEIKQTFSNFTICTIFIENKRILLFLFKKEILQIDKLIIDILSDQIYGNYRQYFQPEIRKFYLNSDKDNQYYLDLPEDFEEKRKIGENDNEICQIIRNDSIDEFIEHTKLNNDLASLSIPISDFETNSILFNRPKYIEYASFYGSQKIFNFLIQKGCKITPILMTYAINGNQLDIIKLLLEHYKKQSSEFNTPSNWFYEAIKCHHNDIAIFFKNKYKLASINLSYLGNHNFLFIEDLYNQYHRDRLILTEYLALYNYPKFSQLLMENEKIDFECLSINDIINDLIESNNIITLKYLLKKYHKIDAKIKDSLLIKTISNGNIEMLNLILIHFNINVNAVCQSNCFINEGIFDNISTLFLAIIRNNIDMVYLLLKYPLIDVNLSIIIRSDRTTYFTALHLAILYQNVAIVKLLLNNSDIDVNALANFDETTPKIENWANNYFDQYFTPLHEAIELENIEIIELLLSHPKILVNKIEIYDTYDGKYKDDFRRVKQTALHRAIQKNNIRIVKLLLEHQSIDVNKVAIYYPQLTDDSIDEETDISIDENDTDDAENNQENNNVKKTALQFAYATKNQEIIQLLLNKKGIKCVDVKNDQSIDVFTKDIKST